MATKVCPHDPLVYRYDLTIIFFSLSTRLEVSEKLPQGYRINNSQYIMDDYYDDGLHGKRRVYLLLSVAHG